MNGRKWTEDEDIYLEYFVYESDSNIEDAAKHLNRSKGAVSTRLTYLRDKSDAVVYIKRRWTEQEDEFIKMYYRQLPDKNIAIRLNRSEQAVKSRRGYLSLSRIRPITRHKAKILELIRKGCYRPEIAKELDIDEKSLSRFLKMNNIYCPAVPYEERSRKIKELERRHITNAIPRKN